MNIYRQQAATEFAAAFETATRSNGDKFVKLAPGAPGWISEAVFEAHCEMMPDDTRYFMIRRVADSIAETLGYDPDADMEDARCESIDSLVPVYHTERFLWLASHLFRSAYCDDAREEEGLVADDATLSDRIAAGIYAEYSEIWSAIMEAIDMRADELAGEDDA